MSLSEVVNQALRDALGCEAAPSARERGRFTVEPVNLGKPLLPDVDDISAVLEYAERLDSDDR